MNVAEHQARNKQAAAPDLSWLSPVSPFPPPQMSYPWD